MEELFELDRKNIWHPFTPLKPGAEFPLITSGKGVYLYTSGGRQILDAISSWWVNLHGHANARIAEAIAVQAAKMEHVIFAGFTHEPAIQLSRNLLEILPSNQRKIFFSDNGSTAVEVALKMTVQYWHNQDIKKQGVIALRGGYHGDTFGSMSVAERGIFTRPFSPYLFETTFIDFPGFGNEAQVLSDFSQLMSRNDFAAFIFEPLVQAAAGMRIYSAELLDKLISLAHERDVICIADEVFTGFGRTGKNFASDHLKHKPDIIALSKGVTGGFLPLGITTCSEKITMAFESPELEKTFFHGHSYTANPLACAAANASFDLLMSESCQERIQGIARKHALFAASIHGHTAVRDVRTLGTILAMEIESAERSGYDNSLRSRIYPFFLERNILLRPLGNVLYVLPPYVISDDELDRIYGAIEEFLGAIKNN